MSTCEILSKNEFFKYLESTRWYLKKAKIRQTNNVRRKVILRELQIWKPEVASLYLWMAKNSKFFWKNWTIYRSGTKNSKGPDYQIRTQVSKRIRHKSFHKIDWKKSSKNWLKLQENRFQCVPTRFESIKNNRFSNTYSILFKNRLFLTGTINRFLKWKSTLMTEFFSVAKAREKKIARKVYMAD